MINQDHLLIPLLLLLLLHIAITLSIIFIIIIIILLILFYYLYWNKQSMKPCYLSLKMSTTVYKAFKPYAGAAS